MFNNEEIEGRAVDAFDEVVELEIAATTEMKKCSQTRSTNPYNSCRMS